MFCEAFYLTVVWNYKNIVPITEISHVMYDFVVLPNQFMILIKFSVRSFSVWAGDYFWLVNNDHTINKNLWNNIQKKLLNIWLFTCLKLTIETPDQGMNMFKVNNKDTRTTSMTSFSVFIVNSEHVITGWESRGF